ncbi:hypothetical protein CYMTET_21677 [Cymbomonas tetramitiformis]|uniref:Major facilitator superfamily (MFS) profile domain-containing protein n=1 Tax=Cymbomonas tetramitiformis TaxID=36881 RepID=A0AAE0L2Z6_9CHLO|nr:hypothetical protein CYMTET_21677 [Cymbomonas tetramitiformis]
MIVAALFVTQWRTLLNVVAIPSTVLLTAVVLKVPESPRWLLLQRGRAAAKTALERMANENSRQFTSNLAPVNTPTTAPVRVRAFLKGDLWVHTPALTCVCFIAAMLYFGLSLGVPELVGNLHLNSALCFGAEIPALLLSGLMLDSRLGRRYTILLGLAMTALLSLLNALIPAFGGLGSSIAKLFISIVYGGTFTLAAEMYSTRMRGVGLSTLRFVEGLGCTLAGSLPLLPKPYLAMAVFGTIAALAALLLPETRGQQLAEA